MSIVQISVNRPAGAGRHSLNHYPRRSGDIVVYFTPPNCAETPGLVREVIWTASGLLPGEKLEIREKGRGQSKGHFQSLPFQLTHGSGAVKQSGRAVKGPPPGQKKVPWQYDIVLLDAGGVELACIDPEVIIIEEP